MRNPHYLLLTLALGCSPERTVPISNSQVETANTQSSLAITAKQACQHLEHEQMDVGISDYEACLGQRANLTRPASRELCDMAKSDISSDGVCILSE